MSETKKAEPTISFLAEYQGGEWHVLTTTCSSPDLTAYFGECGMGEFGLPEPAWREIDEVNQLLRGYLYPQGTRVLVQDAFPVSEHYSTPDGEEWDGHWEWANQLFFLPRNAQTLYKRMASSAARRLLRTGGVCIGCNDNLIDIWEPGHTMKRCPQCTRYYLEHLVHVALDPLYDLRKQALWEWNRDVHPVWEQDEDHRWKILLAKDQFELKELIAQHSRNFEHWLAMWQAYQ